MPPLVMAGARFLLAGILLYACMRWRGEPAPSAEQWRGALIVGSLLLLGGNGLVCLAERTVASSLAALVVATVPLWMVLLPWLPAAAARLLRTLIALAPGLAGRRAADRGGQGQGIDPLGAGPAARRLASAGRSARSTRASSATRRHPWSRPACR
jgi:hypothetical protein